MLVDLVEYLRFCGGVLLVAAAILSPICMFACLIAALMVHGINERQ